MMDDLTANKGHLPCQSWVGQNGWSTTPAQGLPLNTASTSQHLSLGSSSNQSSSYNHLQVPNQSCMRDLGTLMPRDNTHQSAMFKASQAGRNPPSGSLFANAVMPSVSQINPFAQEIPHTSSMLLPANQGKNIPSLSHTQRNQAHVSLPPPDNAYRVSFQPQMSSQGLPNRLQNPPNSLSTCAQRVSTSLGTLEGVNVEFAGVAECTHSYSSFTSQEQCQWIPPSLCRGTGSEPIPSAAAQPNKQQLQEENISPQSINERQRSELLNQRAQLLQQLAMLDKALESMPPEDSSESQSSHAANLSTPSMEDPAQCAETESSSAQQDQSPTAKLKFLQEKEFNSGGSRDDNNLDDPMSDDNDDFSELIPDPAGFSSGDSDHSRPSTPVDEKKPIPSDEESNISKSTPSKPSDVGTPIKARSSSAQKSSEIDVTPAPKSAEKRYRVKKNYCLFCSKQVSKLSRHLETIHTDRPEVAVALHYPKGSKERQKAWNRLLNQGNFAHNKEVLKTGKGQLVARQRPRKTIQAKDFLHCLYCHGLFQSRGLRQHMNRSCPERVKSEKQLEIRGQRIAALCVMEASEDLGITEGLKSILSVMTYDDVTRVIMDDPIILQLGELLLKQHGCYERKKEYIRQKIRQVARLVLQAQKESPMKKLEDFFVPSNFPHTVSAVKVLAGYDQESKTYKAPSLAVKLGYDLQKACTIVESNAVKRGDETTAESARKFLEVYQKKWTSLISSGALKTLRKTKLVRDKEVPLARDVKRLHFHLEKLHDVEEARLRATPSAENYNALCRVILARVILFNRRYARQVSSVELKAFKSRKKSSVQTGFDASVSDLERAMCGFFTRIEIRGTCGRIVPIILKPSFESALELIVEVRESLGVPSENPYLFARLNTLTAFHGSDCVQKYARACGAENPEAMESKKIRKHYAEMLQMMNLDENEAKQILGPNYKEQTLGQDTEDAGTQSNVKSHRASSLAGAPSGPSTSRRQHRGARSKNMTTPRPPNRPDSKGSEGKNIHRTWEAAEVEAVERHMMRFIKRHIVPQKDACVDCLEAEPEALSTRSWKGVKDYVRNRITALKRKKN